MSLQFTHHRVTTKCVVFLLPLIIHFDIVCMFVCMCVFALLNLYCQLPHILPICKSPIKVMNQQFEVGTFERLKGLRGIDADVQLLGALVNFAKAFKMSAQLHYGEKKDLMDLTEKVCIGQGIDLRLSIWS